MYEPIGVADVEPSNQRLEALAHSFDRHPLTSALGSES